MTSGGCWPAPASQQTNRPFSNQTSPLPQTALPTSNPPHQTLPLPRQQQHYHITTASQHRSIPASSFACTISTFIHTPCTPPSLNSCTLHCPHPLQSQPSTNHHITPSPEARPTTSQPPHRLAGDTRPSPARRIQNEQLNEAVRTRHSIR